MSNPSYSGFGGGSTTRCVVDLMVSFDQRARRSPALTTIVPGIGVASTKVPLGDSTWRPPRESWKRRVIEPEVVSHEHAITFPESIP